MGLLFLPGYCGWEPWWPYWYCSPAVIQWLATLVRFWTSLIYYYVYRYMLSLTHHGFQGDETKRSTAASLLEKRGGWHIRYEIPPVNNICNTKLVPESACPNFLNLVLSQLSYTTLCLTRSVHQKEATCVHALKVMYALSWRLLLDFHIGHYRRKIHENYLYYFVSTIWVISITK